MIAQPGLCRTLLETRQSFLSHDTALIKIIHDTTAIKHSVLMNIHEEIPIHLCLMSYQSVTASLISSFVFAINDSQGRVVEALQ